MNSQIQSDAELNEFMEDAPVSETERKRWQLDYYLRNGNEDLLEQIIKREGA